MKQRSKQNQQTQSSDARSNRDRGRPRELERHLQEAIDLATD